MLIEVTQEHIGNGRPRENCSCPIALALKSKLAIYEVEVGMTRVHFGGEDRVKLPVEAMVFVRRFDEGFPVEPFSFELAIPVELLRTS